MLTIGKILVGPTAASYYLDQVARDREDYYAGEGEAPGRWVGAGAPSLDWGGEVDGDDFASLLAGAGVRRPRNRGVAGFDLTFRAPKSVSVLWAIAPEGVARELRAAHDVAVAEALGYMEREACRGRRGTNGVEQVRGAGFVGSAFVHRASRAGDPLLHTHVVVGNLTQGPDGRWGALDGRHLYRHCKAGGYLYQAVLRREVTERLGLEWAQVEQGVADVRGVPRTVIEHFSRRRAEILEHLADRGERSAAAAQIAALQTRRAKHPLAVDRLRLDWAARAAEHGLAAEAVDRLLGRGQVREPAWPGRLLDDLTERASTFGRAELLQALAEGQGSGARVAEIEALADRVLGAREVVALRETPAQAGVSEPRYSTRELLATEARLLEGARWRERLRVARLRPRTLARVIDGHPALSDEQRRLVQALCGRGAGVAVVRAAAGTGKTFALDAAREAWQAQGIPVVGCALSARTALELTDQAGIPSVTIAAVRRHLDQGDGLPRGGVLVVDEAGMVGTRDLAALADAAATARAKLVLVGDDRQLPEIDAGGAFHALAERLQVIELRDVRRQRHAWDRDALDALRNGDIERWARAYRDHGRITVADTACDARAALVNDWSRAPGEAVMIAARRADVRDLNELARQLLKDQGRLSRDELHIADRAFGQGDRVVGTRNDRARGILNGQRGTVRHLDRDLATLTVELDGGRQITLDSAYLAEGHLDHAYALTAHKAQGATVDRTFVLGSQDLYRELGYTALSRHRDEARFYVARGDLTTVDRDLPTPDPVIAGLQQLLARSGAKQLALDNLDDRDSSELTRERAELRSRFGTDLPPAAHVEQLGRERDRAHQALEETDRRIERLHELRDQTTRLHRRERGRLGDLICDAQATRERQQEHCHHTTSAHDSAVRHLHDWLGRHGDAADRLVAVDRELAQRQGLDQVAIARQRAVEQAPSWPERSLPARDRGIGLDR